jgi:HAE1 family hydrophobic/amphiphilic exporter-1
MDFFIHRPIFAAVCSVILLLVGVVSLPSLPVEHYPQLALPQVTVTSFYTGASAEVVESAVTVPLEQQINGVEGMKYITSTSGNDGTSQITVTFDIHRNVDLAAVDVQNRVQTAMGVLPNEVKQTGVSVAKSSSAFVLGMGLYSEHDELSPLFLSNYADLYMVDALKRIPGVAQVMIFGERRFAMRVWLDPIKLAQRGLTAADVVVALGEQNVQVPAGQVGAPPTLPGQAYQFSVRARSRLSEPSQFEEIVLSSLPDGTIIRLKDVGRVELGAQDYSTLLRYNGHAAVGLGVTQLPGSNALDVQKRVLKEAERLKTRFPPGMRYHVAFDTTLAVSESIDEVLHTLAAAVLLVILVIFLFLQTGRSTLIPALALPVSLVGTFFFIKAFGFSINTLTLFGITLATGLVVDDAIVVIENIERFMETKALGAREAAGGGLREVFGAVIATSLVLIAVFVPVAFFPGTTGRIYQQFSLTLAFSVGLSAFVSVTLTPALSALLLTGHKQPSKPFERFNQGLSWLNRHYGNLLAHFLNRPGWVLAVFAACLALTAWLFKQVPTGFVPQEDSGYFIIALQAPEGTSVPYLEKVIRKVEAELHKIPEVSDVFSVGGFSFGGNGPNKGMMFVNLKPWAQRPDKENSVAGVVNRLRGPLGNISEAFVLPFEPPAIEGVGSLGGFELDLEDQGQVGLSALAKASDTVTQAANEDPVLRNVFSPFTANDPLLVLDVERDRAKALGIPLTQIFSTLQVFVGSAYVNDFDYGNRVYRVYAQAEPAYRASPQALEGFYVRSASGAMVPLGALVSSKQTASPQTISHYNLFRSASVSGDVAPGKSSGTGISAMEAVADKVLPPGVKYEWTGLSLEQLESQKQTFAIFALGLAFVFLVLAAQYESLVLPMIILMGVPLALMGALAGQLLRGLSNDIFFQVGLVMLIGLSSKNAILIVEFAHQLRDHGRTIAQAAIEAAQTRLRPILMTSFAFLLGVFPLLVAKGAGSQSRHSLGTAVFGGMIVSTALNLLLIPVLYFVVEVVRERRGRAAGAGGHS